MAMRKLIKVSWLGLLLVYLLGGANLAFALDPSIKTNMTSNTAPSPYIVGANNCAYTSATPNSNQWVIWDGSTSWESNYFIRNCHEDYYLGGVSKVLIAYGIYSDATDAGQGCSAWNVAGSNDDSTWTTLDTQTGQATNPAGERD